MGRGGSAESGRESLRVRSLTERLPYWHLTDGLVVLQGRQLEVPVAITPPATAMRSLGELEGILHTLKSLLRVGVGERERLRLVVEATPMPEGELAGYGALTVTENEAVRYLAEERERLLEGMRRREELLSWRAHVSVTVRRWHQRRPWTAFTRREWEEARGYAERTRQRLVTLLEGAGYTPAVPGDQDVFEMIWRYFNPEMAAVPPRYVPLREFYPEEALQALPSLSPPTLRRQVVESTVLSEGLASLAVGSRWVRVVVVTGLPDVTAFGLVDWLLSVGGVLWVVVDLVHLPYDVAVRRLKSRARRYASVASDRSTAYVDPNVKVGLREIDEALQHISLTGDHVYEVGLGIVLVGKKEEELEDRANRLQSLVSQALPGSRLCLLTHGALEGWLELAPLSGGENSRRGVLLETNAAHYFPAAGPWRGSEQAVCVFENRYGTLTRMDPFDRGMANWNAVVVGGSGSGKTFFMQCMLADLMRVGADVVIVDRGYGYAPFVELVGGAVIPIAPGGGTSINPFDLPEGQEEPDDDKVAFLLALVKAMIGEEEGKLGDAVLEAAIRQTYRRGLTERRVGERVERVRAPVFLSDLVRVLVTLDEVQNRAASAEDRAVAGRLATKLQGWTGDSVYGRFVDRPTSILPDAPVVYYETSALEQQKELEPVALLLIADLVWSRVRRDPSRRKVVVFDEAWALLRRPAAAGFIVELYRRFRRYNAAVYSVTQSLGDFRGETARGILQNTSWYFLLRLPGEEELVQEVLGLSDRGMALFRGLRSRKGHWNEVLAWVRRESGLEGDVVVVRPTPLSYWAFSTDARDVARRQAMRERRHGDLVRALYDLAYPSEG